MALARSNTVWWKRTGYFYKPWYWSEDFKKKHPGVEIAMMKSNKPALVTKVDKSKPDHTGTFWSGDKKVEVATMYAVLQDVEETASVCGVYPYVIRQWKNEPWFGQVVRDVRREKNDKLDAKISEVLDKAVDLITDRILNGEYIYNVNTGDFRRQPLRARDGAYVTEVLFNKRQLLRGEATSRNENVSFDDKLSQLKSKFESLAGKIVEGEVINESSTKSTEGDAPRPDPEGPMQEGETSESTEVTTFQIG